MTMPPDTQAQLREELSKALKDAKFMFTDGLIDEKEYGDLKSHELAKYKTAVAALSAPPATARPRATPRANTAKPKAPAPPLRTSAPSAPDSSRVEASNSRTHASPYGQQQAQEPHQTQQVHRPEGTQEVQHPVHPQQQVLQQQPLQPQHPHESSGSAEQQPPSISVEVDPDMYERLRTPPIFRRRSAAAKRTVVLEGGDGELSLRQPQL